MNAILGADNGSIACDAIYDYDSTGRKEEFDAALVIMDISIED